MLPEPFPQGTRFVKQLSHSRYCQGLYTLMVEEAGRAHGSSEGCECYGEACAARNSPQTGWGGDFWRGSLQGRTTWSGPAKTEVDQIPPTEGSVRSQSQRQETSGSLLGSSRATCVFGVLGEAGGSDQWHWHHL